jgi:hypothetical protein
MIGFYKKNIHLIIENAVLPDKRRYIDPSEAPRHYIDIDHYGDSAIYKMPHNWFQAVEKYSEDTLKSYGIVPWHIVKLKYILTRAFQEKDFDQIIRTSTDIGHYVGDCNVPLHTTENYNGQLTGQYGIHGFWESRLPELFFENYDLFTGQAEYIYDVEERVWQHVTRAHLALDSVFGFEKMLTEEFPEDQKFAFEQRGNSTVKTYSKKFSQAYHDDLNGMVERQMKSAINLLGSIWYTCWVDAGQPILIPVEQVLKGDSTALPVEQSKFKTREHEG